MLICIDSDSEALVPVIQKDFPRAQVETTFSSPECGKAKAIAGSQTADCIAGKGMQCDIPLYLNGVKVADASSKFEVIVLFWAYARSAKARAVVEYSTPIPSPDATYQRQLEAVGKTPPINQASQEPLRRRNEVPLGGGRTLVENDRKQQLTMASFRREKKERFLFGNEPGMDGSLFGFRPKTGKALGWRNFSNRNSQEVCYEMNALIGNDG